MADVSLRRIKAVSTRPGHKLTVTWDQGPSMVIDFASVIDEGGVFEALRDESIFAQVAVNSRRRLIAWPEPKDSGGYPIIEIDAEALFEMGALQREKADVKRLLNAAKHMARDRTPA